MWEYLVKKNKAITKSDDSDIKPIRKSENTDQIKPLQKNSNNNETQHQSASSRLKRTLECPACSSNMNREFISHIEIDRCESCGGIFLDKGELEMIHPGGYSSYAPDKGKASSTDANKYLVYTPHGLSKTIRD